MSETMDAWISNPMAKEVLNIDRNWHKTLSFSVYQRKNGCLHTDKLVSYWWKLSNKQIIPFDYFFSTQRKNIGFSKRFLVCTSTSLHTYYVHPFFFHFPMASRRFNMKTHTQESCWCVYPYFKVSEWVGLCVWVRMRRNEIKNMPFAITLRLFQYPEEGNGRKIALSKYTQQQHQREIVCARMLNTFSANAKCKVCGR